MASMERHVTIQEGSSFPYNMQQTYSFQDDDDPTSQLEDARTSRSGYYRRMEQSRGSPLRLQVLSPVRNGHNSSSVEVREKSISDNGPSDASLPRVPDPHPSWRFYTSYDNGEWKRHMVPVYHSEKDVLNTSPGIGPRSPIRSDSSFSFDTTSPPYALESNIRKMRLGRPSVYECLQNRRQRVSGEHRRIQGPRTAENIMNSIDYLSSDQLKRRYNYDNYSPRRRTEYGERVIYPRVKTDSMSSSESGFKKMSVNVSEEDEVTRSVHPSCLQVDSSATFETSKAEGRPPSIDLNSGERIIIPTKYKEGNQSATTMPVRTILDLVDEPRDILSPHKERVIFQRTPSLSPRRATNVSSHYINSSTDDSFLQPQHRSRLREVSNTRDRRGYEQDKEVKVLLVNPTVSQHVTTLNVGPNNYSRHAGFHKELEPRVTNDSGRSQSREIIVENIQPQQIFLQNQSETYQPNQNQTFQQVHQQNQNYQQQNNFPQQNPPYSHHVSHQQQHLQNTDNSSRGNDLAARVKANTLATVQQMQDRMISDMKNTCPLAAETMDSLMNGRMVEGAVVESKQMSMEQSNRWQDGKPVEGKVTKEARVFSNDPRAGPQDFVEKSTVSQNLSEIPDGTTFIQHPFLQISDYTNSNNSDRTERIDKNRYPSSVFFTPEPSSNDKPRGFLKQPIYHQDHDDKQHQQLHASNTYNNANASNYSSLNNKGRDYTYVPERQGSSAFEEKIIIPTKYKNTAKEPMNGSTGISSRGTMRSVGDDDVARSYRLVTSPGSSDFTDGNNIFQAPQITQRNEKATSHKHTDMSNRNRSSISSRSNIKNVRSNNGNKEWSFEMALKEAV